jgi:hypothetical protein
MRRLLLCVLLTMPLACFEKHSTTPRPTEGCRVPLWPVAPELNPRACGGEVCLAISEVAALVKWKAEVDLIQKATEGCSLIVWTDK